MRKNDITQAFAEVLKKHRTKKGISQEALAEKADIHPTHVGLIERSLRNPSLHVVKALADGLNIPLTQLISEAEEICKRGKKGNNSAAEDSL
jgi:transcriptional regulator with XRE-family HTH domain